MTPQEHLEAFGDPEDADDAASDFADEHQATTVDPESTDGDDGEHESPGGWDGMDQEGAP